MKEVNKKIICFFKRKIANIICLILCFNLVISLFVPMTFVSADDSDKLLIADNDTMDTYQDALISEENGSRYVGRVWSDKSVFTGDISLDYETDGYDGTITNNSDFLHAFSVLGSSQNGISVEKSPLDVVLLLDISTSMTGKQIGSSTEYEYIDVAEKVIKEANELISTLMGDDSSYEVHSANRVAVVVYAGGSQVLLPLNHYQALSSNSIQENSIISESNKAKIEYLTLDIYNKEQHTSTGVDLSASAKYWPKVKTNVTKINNSKSVKSDGQIESEFMFADSTYLQGALYQGMNILATEKDTTYTNPKTGKVEQRVPILITLTDGGTNIVGATKTNLDNSTYFARESLPDKIDWWDPVSWVTDDNKATKAILPTKSNGSGYDHFVLVPNGNPFYVSLSGTDDKVKEAISSRTVAVLLTAGFMKKKVEENYTANNSNGNTIPLQSYGIGLNVENLSDREKIQLNATMNPREYIKAGSSEEQIKTAYETLEKYIKGENPTLTFNPNPDYKWLNTKLSASWTYNHPSDKDSKYDIKSIEDVYYIDQYVTADTENLGDRFKQIIYKVSGDAFNPIEGFNSSGSENAITYVDPIGEYMEVKDVKNLLLFGKLYDISFDKTKYYTVENGKEVEHENKPKKYSYLRKYYKIENNESGNITNYCYPTIDNKENTHYNITFNLDDIKIYVESKKGIESLYIVVPNNALPIQLATINLNHSDSTTSFSTNLDDKKNSTPLRVFYEVGLDDSILSKNGIDSRKISNDYIKGHYKDGYLYFYSNYYSATKYDEYTADTQDKARTKGDAFLTMSPSTSNRYYIFQNNLKVYKYAYVIGDNGQVEEESDPLNFEGADFDGEYAGKTENGQINETAKNALKKAFDEGKLTKGDIITLADDVIKYGENPSSDNYYYFAIDYYMPTSNGGGTLKQYVVSRKGAEFGSGILPNDGDIIPKGDFLSWRDISGKNSEKYDYDDKIPTDKLTGANWVLVTKIGGLRIGDLHRSISLKDENKTDTSESYYLPVINGALSDLGSDVILNTYLGNNGLIKYKFNIKAPNTKDIVALSIIFFTINSILLLVLLYRKKFFKKNKFQN